MTTCYKCGHEGTGSYCGACGADLRGPEDATSTAGGPASAGYSSAPHRSAAPHQEGWQDQPTSTGYQSYRSQNPANPAATPYRSAAGGGAATGGSAPAPGASKSRRSNQMLATLVGVAAVAVFALVAYLFLKPGGGDASKASPSMGNSVATTSSSAPSTSAPTTQQNQGVQNAPAPAPNTVTETRTSQAPASSDDGANSSGTAWSSLSGAQRSGDYGVVQSGDSATVYHDSGSGPQQVSTLHLNGNRSDGGNKQSLSFIDLPGCEAPILVWNAGDANSSGAFGDDGSGHYQLFQSTGANLSPINGDGSQAHTYGVYNKGDHISYRDSVKVKSGDYHLFRNCDSDGISLVFSGSGD